MEEGLPLILDIQENSIIKVLGVGGGGCNAVNYMYKQGIRDVSFLVCNTDVQALEKMSVPAKLSIAMLGAGGNPEKARAYAEENKERIKEALDDGTRMVFITAGMGGGTGTGASPVVAEIAQEMGILTVGIVTIPFAFEGKRAIRKAMVGVANLAQHTDALLVINNEKLKLLFPDFDLPNAFSKADEVVCNAAKSIAEIITEPGYINTDFQDVYNTLKDGNVAIMNVGVADGEKRITRAIENALNSPLVNTTNVHGAGRILLNFYCSEEHAIRMAELDEVQAFSDSIGDDVGFKWGASYDNSLGESVRVTIIATGYSVSDIPGLEEAVQTEETMAENKTTQLETPKITIDGAIDAYYGNIANGGGEQKEIELVANEVQDIPSAPTIVWEEDDIIDLDNLSANEQQQIEDVPAYMRRR
ncbi:MAG: cell division protein FtsZ [Paludibacter sp.]|nr:cell division protein FtsZ [Bacteroidales bacterium]MCM1069204.1 cell division protein FtsZ [Prevotella sp.]MCM1354109.1 cell division protein FtsZ [Bacteroides sp.]MCM1442918.1 cell division protein FtsZ [Muribaculum sp.]MCM1481759.1 cell division protein FtsZ [Paludibacter sp.]